MWHRKTGKDFWTVCHTFTEMIKTPGNYYYFFPKYTQGKKVLWEGKCNDGIPFMARMPKEFIKRKNETEMLIELKNGSIFRIVGADSKNVDNLIGANPIGIAMSEYGVGNDYQIVLEKFLPVLQNNDGWLAINGTTRGRNHYYDLYSRALKMPETWYVSTLQTISPDYPTGRYTGIISPEKLQMSLDSGMDINIFHQENGVSFAAGVVGSIFGKQVAKAASDGRILDFPIDKHNWVETFWDLGSSDMCTIWFAQRFQDRVYWIDYYQNNNEDWEFYVKLLKKKNYNYKRHHLPHDGRNTYVMLKLNPKMIFQRCLDSAEVDGRVIVHDRPTNKNTLYDGCKMRFETYYFHKTNCDEGIRLIENYRKEWDPVKKKFSKNAIHDESSHCADSLMLESICKNPLMHGGKKKVSGLIRINASEGKRRRSRLDDFNTF